MHAYSFYKTGAVLLSRRVLAKSILHITYEKGDDSDSDFLSLSLFFFFVIKWMRKKKKIHSR